MMRSIDSSRSAIDRRELTTCTYRRNCGDKDSRTSARLAGSRNLTITRYTGSCSMNTPPKFCGSSSDSLAASLEISSSRASRSRASSAEMPWRSRKYRWPGVCDMGSWTAPGVGGTLRCASAALADNDVAASAITAYFMARTLSFTSNGFDNRQNRLRFPDQYNSD